ncbi:hypothetical protein BDR06DRAFT_1003950 [Suillus hirtellus]|nr:hypothetical protein BDR06DRAFT_1003950 [Suillus hirtellus]
MSRKQNWSLLVSSPEPQFISYKDDQPPQASFGDKGHDQPESEIVTSHNPGSDQTSRLPQYSPASGSYRGDNQTFGTMFPVYSEYLKTHNLTHKSSHSNVNSQHPSAIYRAPPHLIGGSSSTSNVQHSFPYSPLSHDAPTQSTSLTPGACSYENELQQYQPDLMVPINTRVSQGFRSPSPVHVQHSTKQVMFLSTKPIIHTIPPRKPVSLLTPLFILEEEIDAVKKEANIQMYRLVFNQMFFPTNNAALGRMAELALDMAIAKCSNADFSGWKLLREGQNEIRKLKGVLTKIRNEIKDLILTAVVNAYSLSLAIEKRSPVRLSPRIEKINLLLTTNAFLHGLMMVRASILMRVLL